MKIYIELFITGMSLGLSSCLYFCAPVTLAYISATQTGWRKGLEASLAFSLGRIIAYLILSLISASLGAYLIRQFYAQRGELLIHAGIGVFIVLLGVLIILGKSPHLSVCWSLKKVKVTSEDSILQQKGGIKEIVLLGLLVGLAPCLPLFEVLTFIALKAQNYLHGVFLGLAFALGTLV